MTEIYLVDIPIYRTSPEVFYQDIETQYNHRVRQLETYANPKGLTEAFKAGVKVRLEKKNGGPWRYNQIVGWLRVYRLGGQLRGEYWFVERERITKNPVRKQICWQGNAFEFTVYEDASSEEIRDELLQEITVFEKNLRPKRHFDYSAFLNMSRFVDWRAIMSSPVDTQ